MQKTTNVYILADTSYQMSAYSHDLHALFLKYRRTSRLSGYNIKLHYWQYSDRARLLNIEHFIKTSGNPDLGEGLNMLKNLIQLQREMPVKQTRSVFMLFTGKDILRGWERPLNELFALKEFVFGLRYAITFGRPNRYTLKTCFAFTEVESRILNYFSANRLISLQKISIKNADILVKIRCICYNEVAPQLYNSSYRLQRHSCTLISLYGENCGADNQRVQSCGRSP